MREGESEIVLLNERYKRKRKHGDSKERIKNGEKNRNAETMRGGRI